MFGVGLEAQTSCTACGRVLQVNALVPAVRCSGCGASNELTDLWPTVLRDFDDLRRCELGESRKWTVARGERYLIARRIRADPALAADFELASGKGWAASDTGVHVVRAVPDEFAPMLPGTRYVIDEDPTTLAESGARPNLPEPPKVEGLSAACVSCGGAIDLRGKERIVACPHCSSVAFVSDEVWGRLHPDRHPRRFFLWLDGDPAPEPSDEEDPLERFDSHRFPAASFGRPDAAYWVGFNLSRTCERCNGAIAVAAVVETIACPTCQATHIIEPAEWTSMLIEACRDSEDDDDDDDDNDDDDDDDDDDGDDGDDDAESPPVSPNAARELLNQTAGARTSAGPWVRTPPPFVAETIVPAGIQLLMGEAPEVVSEAVTGGPGVEGVTFKCPQCGGSLQPDGRQRLIECQYCNVGLGLPDSVWRRLHPASNARLWMLYDPHAPIFEHQDVRDAVGTDEGTLYLVGRAEHGWRLRLYALDRSLRLRWYVNLKPETAPQVSLAAAGPFVWWIDDSELAVREFDGEGELRRERRVAVPPTLRVHDIDADLRVLGTCVEHGYRGRSFHTLVTLDLDDGTCTRVWPVNVPAWRRVLAALAQTDRGPIDLEAIGPQPRWIPSNARVVGGPEGSVALVQGAVAALYTAEGDVTRVDLPGEARADRIRRGAGGWLVPHEGSSSTLAVVQRDGDSRTLLTGREPGIDWPGWPTRSTEGRVVIVTDFAYLVYDSDGKLLFKTWRARQ